MSTTTNFLENILGPWIRSSIVQGALYVEWTLVLTILVVFVLSVRTSMVKQEYTFLDGLRYQRRTLQMVSELPLLIKLGRVLGFGVAGLIVFIMANNFDHRQIRRTLVFRGRLWRLSLSPLYLALPLISFLWPWVIRPLGSLLFPITWESAVENVRVAASLVSLLCCGSQFWLIYEACIWERPAHQRQPGIPHYPLQYFVHGSHIFEWLYQRYDENTRVAANHAILAQRYMAGLAVMPRPAPREPQTGALARRALRFPIFQIVAVPTWPEQPEQAQLSEASEQPQEAEPRYPSYFVVRQRGENRRRLELTVNDDDDLACTICREEYDVEDDVLVMPTCGHYVHNTCGREWWRQRMSCVRCTREYGWVPVARDTGLRVTGLTPRRRGEAEADMDEAEGEETG